MNASLQKILSFQDVNQMVSYKEALQNVEIIISEWIETAKELDRIIPEPKGKLMYA